MAAYRGILLTVKDKNTPISTKLKLARFAWAQHDVIIPNKYQQILDFVCGLLVNKKKNNLEKGNEALVWQSLLDFLTVTQSTIAVKPSIQQAVVENIQARVKEKSVVSKQDRKNLANVIDCGLLLLSIPSLHSSLFSGLCHQLSGLCHLCLLDSIDHTLLNKARALIQATLSVLCKRQTTYHDQAQVVLCIADMLPIVFKYQEKFADESLQNFLLTSLFHKDHKEAHTAYLKSTFSDGDKASVTVPPKYVTKFHSVLSDNINPYMASKFLPAFATEFMKQNRSDPGICFLFLKHVVDNLLKLTIGPQSKLPGHLTQETWISCLGGCFKACSTTDCDLLVSENRQDVIKWFCLLVELVLPQSSVSSWYDFMTSVLNLSPLVIEKYLTDILKEALTKRKNITTDTEIAQDLFLSALVAMFLKLRRTSDFLSSLLLAIDSEVSCDGSLTCFVKFKEKLGIMFNEAPITSLMDMWEKIEEGLESAVQMKKSKEKCDKLSWLLLLFDSLLSHARLFDQRSLGVAEKRLHSLLELTENNVLMHLAKAKQEIPLVSDVLCTWATVKVMLYPKWREHGLDGEIGEMNENKTTIKIMKQVSLPAKISLSLQRQHIASPARVDKVGKEKPVDVNELFEELMNFPSPSAENVSAVLSGNEENASSVHQPLLQFREFSKLFPLVGCKLSDELVQKCATFIVDVFCLTRRGKGHLASCHTEVDSVTLGEEVRRFLSHPSTRESRRLQTQLACLTWKKLLAPSGGRMDSPRKKKSKKSKAQESDERVPKLLELITNAEMDIGDFCICPKEIADSMVIAETANVALIEMLISLDLEYLPVINLRCQLGFLAMAACLKPHGVSQKDNLVTAIESALQRCLSGQNLAQFFSVVKPEDFLDFAFALCSEPLNMSTGFLDCAIQVVMNNRLAVLSILPQVKQVAMDLRCDNIKPTGIRILTASKLIHNCRHYIAKNFHLEDVAAAAMDIFCTLAKVTVKHALNWVSHDEYHKDGVTSEGKKRGAITTGSAQKSKKRKFNDLDEQNLQTERNKNAFNDNDLWCPMVECVTEVLMLWSHNIADERMNRQLSLVVGAIRGKMRQYMESFKDRIPDQAKLVQLNFLKYLCLCNSRLSQPLSSTLTSEPIPKTSFCLVDEKGIADIWQYVFDQATSEFSAFYKAVSTHKPDSIQESDPKEQSVGLLVPELEAKKESGLCEFESWPKPLTACLDVLLCVMETDKAVQEEKFLNRLQILTKQLIVDTEPDLPSVLIALSVWRRLIASTFLSDVLSDELIHQLYQFLATSMNLLQNLDCQKVLQSSESTPSASLSSSTPSPLSSAALSSSSTRNAESVQIRSASCWSTSQTFQKDLVSVTCQFILDTMSDFVNMSKAFNTPDITKMCLQAGPLFSLACPRDVQALQRLVNTYVVHHPSSAIKAASAVMSLVSKLVCSCVQLGSQTRLTDQCPEEMDDVVKCAQLISRVLVVLTAGDFKKELSKIAHCVLSDYVMEIQKGALHPKIKTELVRGLYQLMGICDKFRLSALNAALPSGTKETFKFMHQDFEKYYRYQGTV